MPTQDQQPPTGEAQSPPIMPLPTVWMVQTVRLDSGDVMVALQAQTPLGQFVHLVPLDTAVQLLGGLSAACKHASEQQGPSIALPTPTDIEAIRRQKNGST